MHDAGEILAMTLAVGSGRRTCVPGGSISRCRAVGTSRLPGVHKRWPTGHQRITSWQQLAVTTPTNPKRRPGATSLDAVDAETGVVSGME